jgi:hypothetical protein
MRDTLLLFYMAATLVQIGLLVYLIALIRRRK